MSDQSHIQWTDSTWNTVTGCTRVSDGCLNCYIDRTPPFRMAHRKFDSPQIGGKTGIILHEDRLILPLSWRKPRRVFVNSLSDLFHEDVPTEHIAKVFGVMALARQHSFQLLTKRPARMRSLLQSGEFADLVWRSIKDAYAPHTLGGGRAGYVVDHFISTRLRGTPMRPLPNVWLGVSVESQKWADIRIPQLVQTPAAVRFLSCEPLLGEVSLRAWLATPPECGCWQPGCSAPRAVERSLIDWVIVGGESGPGARPMDSLWAMDLVVQCSGHHVPVFVKQLGSMWARENGALDRKGGNPEEWPNGLRVREFPRSVADRYVPEPAAA